MCFTGCSTLNYRFTIGDYFHGNLYRRAHEVLALGAGGRGGESECAVAADVGEAAKRLQQRKKSESAEGGGGGAEGCRR